MLTPGLFARQSIKEVKAPLCRAQDPLAKRITNLEKRAVALEKES